MKMSRIAAVALAAIIPVAPAAVAVAHTVGTLDSHGCHADRRDGAYHCHRGDYAGLHFRSKSDMLKKKSQGYNGEDQRAEERSSKGKSWLSSLWPFRKSAGEEEQGKNAKAEAKAEGLAPSPHTAAAHDIEQRLTLLKQLHEKELISDQEFANTKRQILGGL